MSVITQESRPDVSYGRRDFIALYPPKKTAL